MNSINVYKEICEFSPTHEQSDAFDALVNWNTSRKLLILRFPCGYGKTEAVVIPFLSQFFYEKWTLAPRLIYVLPTRALCNQIHDRIQKYADSTRSHTKQEIAVGIEHGSSSLDPLFFSDICITTFDQLLYGYARAKSQVGRHFDLPAGAIANSVVVFDEAHLYSPYTHSLMRAIIEIFVTSRIPTIMMTATMPRVLQQELAGPEDIHQIEFRGEYPAFMSKRSIQWSLQDWGLLDKENMSGELNELLDSNKKKRILIVVNRVDTAQKLGKTLQKRDEFITLIHSRFTVEDRELREKDVCEYFGKAGDKQKPGIIVSTQVCEVGLDISCDVLITECASADALVQRVGRVARWGGAGKVIIVRPMGSEDPIADAQWGEAYPYVDKKKDFESKFDGIKKGEFAGIAWEYLKNEAPGNLFTDWKTICAFCDEMDYHTDDVEARSALGQLFDSTLYADERPWNLSARGELYCSLAVISKETLSKNMVIGEEDYGKVKKVKKKKAKSEQEIPYEELRKKLINVSFRYLMSKDTKKLRRYDFAEGRLEDELNKARVKPFQTYVVNGADSYDSNTGLTFSKKEKLEETEEAACLIL